jgi:acyl-coenzyme A thioesterase PaaI-like protein
LAEIDAERVAKVRNHYAEVCFACGRDNPIGLHLEPLELDDEGWVHAGFRPREHYRGAHDALHGGIAATALDEIMVWAGVLAEGVVCVTGTLELRYRAPLTIHDEIIAKGRVDDRSGRRLRISGALSTTDGRTAVEGSGLYLANVDVDSL